MKSKQRIHSALKTALEKLTVGKELIPYTDIYLQPSSQTSGLLIYDDEEKPLIQIDIDEWKEVETQDFQTTVKEQLTGILAELEKNGDLANYPLPKPYSFVLVNEQGEIISDLLLVDDETMLVSQGLLEGLDEELNAFLKDLLEN